MGYRVYSQASERCYYYTRGTRLVVVVVGVEGGKEDPTLLSSTDM